MGKSEFRSRLFDLAAAAPLLVWFSFSVGQLIKSISQTTERDGEWLSVCLQLSNVILLSLLLALLIIRRPPIRKAHGVLPRAAGLVGLIIPSIAVVLPKAKLEIAPAVFSSALMLFGTVASIAICCWLGRSFSVLPQARGLVTNGPYRFVRHPLYAAELISLLGFIWGFERPWSLVLMFVATVAQFPRMRFEENILTEAFPSYREYANRTARLIPGVY